MTDERDIEPTEPVGSAASVDEPRAAPASYHGELKDYRQPLVTSLGIILGFLLGYLGTWANSSNGGLLADGTDVAVFVTIMAAVIVFVVVLYRMLTPRVPAEPLHYYHRTLILYITGIVIAFGGFLIAWLI